MDPSFSPEETSTAIAEPTPPATPPTNNILSDIFSDSPPLSGSATQNEEVSEIPRLRSTHVTAGYREGISASKDQALQPGFDEAYPLGAILGLRAGYILGVLEEICAAHSQKARIFKDEAIYTLEAGRVQTLVQEAREQLKVERIFGKEFWKSDGTWGYDAGEMKGLEEQGDNSADLTFWEVADRHPAIRFWMQRLGDEMRKVGLDNGEDGFIRTEKYGLKGNV
ncbi:MAG: hypothetical protein LQ342_001152 [Letrouitia transgressa]|nr:MAG: hypothetical protein LQ342_001152 [Letrouitia transgressa]